MRIITVWRTRREGMDLYAISLVEHCANLLSNGTAARVTCFFLVFFMILFEALLVTGRFLSPPESLLTFIPLMMNLEKMEYEAYYF